MKQILLPSQRVASMRPMKWIDWVVTATAPSIDMRVLIAACRLTTIDGKPLSIDEASEMSMADAAPLITEVMAQVSEGYAKPEEAPPADGMTLQ